jgi:predicted permease
MISTTQSLFQGIAILFVAVVLAIVLKKLNILKKDDSLLFSRIVLYITLPALIFSSLAQRAFTSEFLMMAGMMTFVELLIMALAWLFAKLFKFDSGKTGALILVSSFGMTTMLGYPLIRQVFPGNTLAMEEAVITSEFGVGLLLFIMGPLIAMYYGKTKVEGKILIQSVRKFFVSPIFISLIAGILISLIPQQNKDFIKPVIHFFGLIGNANLLMVTFTIGLLIEIKKAKSIYLFLAIAIVLKLIIKPLLAIIITQSQVFSEMMREIILIETALPSAILTVVFAKQYNCRPDLVSLAIMTTLILSLASVSLMFYILF